MVDTNIATSIQNYLDARDIIDLEEPTGDISATWIIQNEDLQALEQPIPIVNFVEQSLTRNKDMEFRVKFVILYIYFIFLSTFIKMI